MGGSVSKPDNSGRERSKMIDKQLAEDWTRSKHEDKAILLGCPGAGKSTIIKQMQIIQDTGITDADLAGWRPAIYKNVLESAQQIVMYMKKVGFECFEYSNVDLAERILDYRLDTTGDSPFLALEIAESVHQLWKDPIIPKIMDEHSSEFYLMDSASYFFEEVLRIGAPGYLPTVTDVLRTKKKTLSVTETRFTFGQLSINVFDVGGLRGERKKWIHYFESVTSIIFCIALSDYDQVLLEEKTRNRMLESLVLFESVINSRWFLRPSIILFLNKIDLFEIKLPQVPLKQYFPEYTGGPDMKKATNYILSKFMQANRARLSVYPHLTQATDTTNIRLVFADLKKTVLQNSLDGSGAL